jgi:hypothetical protein
MPNESMAQPWRKSLLATPLQVSSKMAVLTGLIIGDAILRLKTHHLTGMFYISMPPPVV